MLSHPRDLVAHVRPQGLGCEYLDVVPMAEDVHDELGRIGIGEREPVMALGIECANLVRVPLFARYPACRPGRET